MPGSTQKLSYYISKVKSLKKNDCEKKIKIGLLSSFTINGLEETLQVLSFENKIDSKTYLGNYNQYNQNILDEESDLYKFNPDSSSRPPAAKASGDDRLPGQRTICSKPLFWNALNS